MLPYTIVLFGESEKGKYHRGYYCRNLAELSENLGEPPSEASKGLHFAIQALMYERDVLFFRVHEEGFSTPDYLNGFQLLETKVTIPKLSAICLPGVGSSEIIEATVPLCEKHKSFLILTEADLYDYLTDRGPA